MKTNYNESQNITMVVIYYETIKSGEYLFAWLTYNYIQYLIFGHLHLILRYTLTPCILSTSTERSAQSQQMITTKHIGPTK